MTPAPHQPINPPGEFERLRAEGARKSGNIDVAEAWERGALRLPGSTIDTQKPYPTPLCKACQRKIFNRGCIYELEYEETGLCKGFKRKELNK